jgi:hypothetical protein
MTGKVGQSILTGFIVLVGVPLVAILFMVTLIGIPTGIGVLLFLGPALLFLGYLVAGSWLGRLVLSRAPGGPGGLRATLLGLLILQLILLVPGLGWIVFPLGGIWGTGARRSEPASWIRRGRLAAGDRRIPCESWDSFGDADDPPHRSLRGWHTSSAPRRFPWQARSTASV